MLASTGAKVKVMGRADSITSFNVPGLLGSIKTDTEVCCFDGILSWPRWVRIARKRNRGVWRAISNQSEANGRFQKIRVALLSLCFLSRDLANAGGWFGKQMWWNEPLNMG